MMMLMLNMIMTIIVIVAKGLAMMVNIIIIGSCFIVSMFNYCCFY